MMSTPESAPHKWTPRFGGGGHLRRVRRLEAQIRTSHAALAVNPKFQAMKNAATQDLTPTKKDPKTDE